MGRPKPWHATGLNRRTVVKGAGAAAVFGFRTPAISQGRSDRQPNILFILADDLGYADLSHYGRRDKTTPKLDTLASEGMQMPHAYANSPSCTPTRVALITGRYQQRFPIGLEEPIRIPDRTSHLPADVPTLPSVLKSAGYRTALVGKWHMGWPPAHGPLRSGYDRFFGIAPAGANYFTHTANAPGDKPANALFEGDEPTQAKGYLTDLLANRAIQEIEDSARTRAPFFLSLHFTAPHSPWQGPDDAPEAARISSTRHLDGGSLEMFATMVRAMDSAVGRVLRALDRSGAARNTIVIFTSDNGGDRFSDTWPLRGGKRELLEGGIRVPLLVRWPGHIAPGARSEQVSISMDWLPTLAAAAGVPLGAEIQTDGENLLDVLNRVRPAQARKLFWRFDAGEQAAARDGDWKYLRMNGQEELFNVATDPRERVNRSRSDAVVLQRLRADWNAWNASMLPRSSTAAAQDGS